ncbi:unnamed protein product [Nezara viridula]|uniref:Pro-corazonin n=1 Tax=Nezara viridula TaxID=85310 RepID=A0A9P0HN05_NEZVI|nr:unnamed protein product [Nezara viridula]
MSLRTEVLLIVAVLVGFAMTAKIQYSRGWTNGAEGDRPKIKINDCLAELTLAQIQKSQFLPIKNVVPPPKPAARRPPDRIRPGPDLPVFQRLDQREEVLSRLTDSLPNPEAKGHDARKAIPTGKDISYHLLCDLYRLPEEDLKMDQLDKTQLRNPGAEDTIEK